MKRKRRIKIMPLLFVILIIGGIIFSVFYLLEPDNDVLKNSNKVEDKKSKKDKKSETKKMSLVAVGDCLIHGAVYMDARVGYDSYDFSGMIENIKPLISDYDLKYYNQETIIGGKALGVSHYPRFNSPEEIGDNMVDLVWYSEIS